MKLRNGFTILEVLIVSVILSLVVGVAIEAVRGARVVTARVTAHYDAAAHASAALAALRRDIAATLSAGDDSFVGVAESAGGPFPGAIAMITLAPPDLLGAPARGDVQHVEYRLEPRAGDEGPLALVRRVTPLAPGTAIPRVRARPERPDAPFEPVALRLISLTARFSDGKRLRDTWERDRGLPAAVELALAVRGPVGQPPFALHTLVTLAAGEPAP